MYVSFHSYGSFLFHPWAHSDAVPRNIKEIRTLAKTIKKSIETFQGTKYQIGSPSKILYSASGSSLDWVKSIGVRYAYTFELPGNNFKMPEDSIISTVKETFLGLKILINYITIEENSRLFKKLSN